MRTPEPPIFPTTHFLGCRSHFRVVISSRKPCDSQHPGALGSNLVRRHNLMKDRTDLTLVADFNDQPASILSGPWNRRRIVPPPWQLCTAPRHNRPLDFVEHSLRWGWPTNVVALRAGSPHLRVSYSAAGQIWLPACRIRAISPFLP